VQKIMDKLNIKSSGAVKVILAVALAAVVILAVVFVNVQSGGDSVLIVASEEPMTGYIQLYQQMPQVGSVSRQIAVYVSGHVYNPDVFYFYEGARVRDAIAAAGGMTGYADPRAINLADFLFDTQHIVVFGMDDNMPPAVSSSSGGQSSSLININRATADELMTLSGIGSARADAIIRHREQRGGFNNIEELMNVSGIGESIFGNIRDQIRVD